MNSNIRSLAFLSMVAAAGAAGTADTGTLWHVTTSMSGLGLNMPSRVTDMCVTGSQQNQPPPAGQSDCQYSELSRSGSTVRYAVQCSTMKGTGEISYSADHYTGKFDMQSARGAVSATYEGQRVGTCDGAPAGGGAQGNGGVQAASGALSNAASGAANATSSAATGAMSTVGSEVKSGVAQGASQVKDAATDVATDAAQSAKDDATQSVKDKAEGVLKGLFGR